MKNNTVFAALVTVFAIILSGCVAAVPMASTQADAEAKKMEVPAGKAVIYVISYGGSAPFGNNWVNQITVNRENRGALAYKTYQVYTVDPGPVSVLASPGATQAVVKLTAAAGKAHFVQVKSLAFGRVGAEQIDESTARPLLQQCALAESL